MSHPPPCRGSSPCPGAASVRAAAQVIPVVVSVATDGTPGNNNSFTPAMSASGRSWPSPRSPRTSSRVTPTTSATCSCGTATRMPMAIFDEAGAVATVRVSQRDGLQANGASEEPAITADGALRRLHVVRVEPLHHRAAAAHGLRDSALGPHDRRHRAGQPDDGRRSAARGPFGRRRRLRRRQPGRVQVWRQPAELTSAPGRHLPARHRRRHA